MNFYVVEKSDNVVVLLLEIRANRNNISGQCYYEVKLIRPENEESEDFKLYIVSSISQVFDIMPYLYHHFNEKDIDDCKLSNDEKKAVIESLLAFIFQVKSEADIAFKDFVFPVNTFNELYKAILKERILITYDTLYKKQKNDIGTLPGQDDYNRNKEIMRAYMNDITRDGSSK